jgi:hypothetical protein
VTPKKRLGEMLVEAGVIDAAGLSAALSHHRQWGMRLGQALVELRLATERDIVQTLSRKLGIELAVLHGLAGREFEEGMKLIPREFAKQHNLIAMGDDGAVLTVAMSDPVNVNVIDELAFRTGRKIKVAIGGDREVAEAVRRHYGVTNPRVESIALDLDPADDGVMTLVGQEHADDEAEWRTKEVLLPRHTPVIRPPDPDERTARHDLLGSVPPAGFDVEKTTEVAEPGDDDILEPPLLEPELEPEIRPPPRAPAPAPPPVLAPALASAEPAEEIRLPSAAAAAVAAVAARGSGDPVLADAARVLSAVLRVLVRKGVVTDAEITGELRQYTPTPRPKR